MTNQEVGRDAREWREGDKEQREERHRPRKRRKCCSKFSSLSPKTCAETIIPAEVVSTFELEWSPEQFLSAADFLGNAHTRH